MQNRNYDLRVDAVYRVPGEAPTRIKALLMYLLAAAGLVGSSLLSVALQKIFPDMGYWPRLFTTSAIYYFGVIILPLWLLLKKGGRGSMRSMRLNPVPARTALLAVAMALIAVFCSNNLAALWALPFDALGFDVFANGIQTPKTFAELLLAVVTVGIMPGVCEEALFRGYMQPAFEKSGTKRSVLLIPLLFMLLHGSVVGMPSHFILGFVMTALLVITDSIYPSVIFHSVYNSATMTLAYLQTSAGVAQAAPGELFASLGIAGVVMIIIQLPIQFGGIFFILRSMYCRAKKKGLRIIEKQPLRLRGGEIALLCVSIGFAAMYYILDILAMTGVLK